MGGAAEIPALLSLLQMFDQSFLLILERVLPSFPEHVEHLGMEPGCVFSAAAEAFPPVNSSFPRLCPM